MPQTTRWSVQCRLTQPPAVRRAGAALAGLAAGSVALGLVDSGVMAAAVSMLGAALAYWLHRPPPDCELAADASGRWALRVCAAGAPSPAPAGHPLPLVGEGKNLLPSPACGRGVGGEGAPWHPVTPARIWRGPCWITVQFVAARRTQSLEPLKTQTFTIWRNAVAPDVWRKLAALLRARPADGPATPAAASQIP